MSGNKNTPASGRGGTARSNVAAAEQYVCRRSLFPSLFFCLSSSFLSMHQCCFAVPVPLWLDSSCLWSRTTSAAETTSGAAADAAAVTTPAAAAAVPSQPLQFAAAVPRMMPAAAGAAEIVADGGAGGGGGVLSSLPRHRTKNRVKDTASATQAIIDDSYAPGLAESPPKAVAWESIHFDPEVQDMPSYDQQMAAEMI